MLRSIALSLLASSAAAAPQVVTDITPVHSLMAQVMEGVGTPHLLVRPGASPHTYALRPSDARALQGADVVVWVGEALSPWLEDPVRLFAETAVTVELMDVDGTKVLPNREGDEEEHGDHGHEHHHHGAYDPHIWLDPANAMAWISEFATVLSDVDPDNADTYAGNAAAALDRLKALDAAVVEEMAAVKSNKYVAVHDAFQYFESRYDLNFAGSITNSDDVAPGAGGLAELTENLRGAGVTCAVTEPGSNPRWLDTLLPNGEGSVAIISPLGVEYEAGPALYDAIISGLAGKFRTCLGR